MSLAPSHIGRPSDRLGLSLQEILVVIAVFGVLAVIFLFSSSHVVTKTRTSKVKHDQKTMSMALNEYLGTNSEYPSSEEGLPKLLATSFLTQLPKDPFSEGGKEPYLYYSFTSRHNGLPYYILASRGPDGQLDFDPSRSKVFIYDAPVSGHGAPSAVLSWDALSLELNLKSYDPTNGINSDGDIFQFE